jgi:hypothetical protein
MATFRPQHGRFGKDLYRSAAEQKPSPSWGSPDYVVDMNRLAEDELYAKLEVIHARAALAKLVDPAQLAAYLDEIAHLSPFVQWHKIAAQVLLQQAAAVCNHLNAVTTHTSRMEQGEATVREWTTCPDCGAEVDEGIAGLESEMELPY